MSSSAEASLYWKSTAARRAKRDAMRLILLVLHQRGAEVGRRFCGKMRRQDAAGTERREARVGVAKPVFGIACPIPNRHDTQRCGEVFDNQFGAQLVEIEPVDQRGRECARAIEKESAAILGQRFGRIARWQDRRCPAHFHPTS